MEQHEDHLSALQAELKEVEAKIYEGYVSALEAELEKVEAKIEEDNQMLADTQAGQQLRTAKKTALQHTIGDITTSGSAIESQCQAAAKEIETAQAACNKLLTQLEEQLSEERRRYIKAAIQSVDGEIGRLQTEVETLTTQIKGDEQIKGAEEELSEANDKVTSLEADFQHLQAQLRQLPAQITDAQSKVATLKTAAEGAAKSGRASEAFFLATDLQKAINTLQKVADPRKETELLESLLKFIEKWDDLDKAKDEAAAAAKELEKLKRARTETEQKLKLKEQGRDADIRAKLAAAPKSPEQSKV